MGRSSTSFGPGNQASKKNSGWKRKRILDAIVRAGETEDGFYDLLVQRTFAGDDFAFGELIKRMHPVEKAVAPMIEFDFPKKGKPHEKAAAVMAAVANGEVPPDIGATFIMSIKSMIEIEESTELKQRIEKLEDMLNG